MLYDPLKDKTLVQTPLERLQRMEDAASGGLTSALRRMEEQSLLAGAARRMDLANLSVSAAERGLANSMQHSALSVALSKQTEWASQISRSFAHLHAIGPFTVANTAMAHVLRTQELLRASAMGSNIASVSTNLALRGPELDFISKTNTLFSALSVKQSITATGLASITTVDTLAKSLASLVRPFDHGALAGRGAWDNLLAAKISAIREPWLLADDPARSVLGIAHLTNLRRAASDPYSRPAREFLNDELGEYIGSEDDADADERDAAAIEAGMRAELVAFRQEAFSSVVVSVGFEFRVPMPPVPQAVEGGDSTAAFDPKYWAVIVAVEQRLRKLIEEELLRLAGPNWIRRRVSERVRKRWMDRQQEDREERRAVYAPIQYADFMDLADVIGQSNNWSEAFQAVFKDREEFVLSLRRLHPIRKAQAHSRPLGLSEVLRLVVEAQQILSALDCRKLS